MTVDGLALVVPTLHSGPLWTLLFLKLYSSSEHVLAKGVDCHRGKSDSLDFDRQEHVGGHCAAFAHFATDFPPDLHHKPRHYTTKSAIPLICNNINAHKSRGRGLRGFFRPNTDNNTRGRRGTPKRRACTTENSTRTRRRGPRTLRLFQESALVLSAGCSSP